MAKFTVPSSWKTVCLILPFAQLAQGQSLDWANDPCPYQGDSVCSAEVNPDCPAGSDVVDCDPCQQYAGNCGDCTANGCHFCVKDNLCFSSPVTSDFWSNLEKPSLESQCWSETDWSTNCDANPDNFYSDPYYTTNEWAFDQLNVKPVWEQGYTGKGVTVRVNDPSGVDTSHPEFAGRVNLEGSCEGHEALLDPADGQYLTHGTFVAGVAVSGGNNDDCSVGIAPGANLTACRGPVPVYSDLNPTTNFINGLTTTDISINSWGFDACAQRPVVPGGRLLQDDGECPFVGIAYHETGALTPPCEACPEQGFALDSPECRPYIVAYCDAGNREINREACTPYQDQFVDCDYVVLSDAAKAVLKRGVTEGRNGKGIIYMMAAGNEYKGWEDVNMEGWLNTRFTTLVAALDKAGKHASYSTGGAAVFISGPGGDTDYYGLKGLAAPTPVGNGGGCGDSSFGTSFATPMVSGAIALLLQVNPELGWRDVQGILATTARMVDSGHPSWTTNGADLHHSELYGFGAMDTAAAAEAAKTWDNFGPEEELTADSGVINLAIPNDPEATVTSSVTVAAPLVVTVESVAVLLQLEHVSRGDVEIILTSPDGTESILHPGNMRENVHLEGDERWELLTVRNYFETANGEWKLSLTDKRVDSVEGCVDLPFQINFNYEDLGGDIDWGCNALADARMGPVCVNNTMPNPEWVDIIGDSNAKSAAESCCACGGGLETSTVAVNQLVSWQLAVYGHEHRIFESETGYDVESGTGGMNPQFVLGAATVLAALPFLG